MMLHLRVCSYAALAAVLCSFGSAIELRGQGDSQPCYYRENAMFFTAPGCPEGEYRLVLSDDFEGSDLDLSKWDPRTGLLRNPGEENQCYLPEQVVISNGSLRIDAEHSPTSCYNYSSNSQTTRPIISGEVDSRFRYGKGYYEARVKLPSLVSHGLLWPAFWIYGEESWQPNPHVTEVDIFEYWGDEGCDLHMTTHIGDRNCGCWSELRSCSTPIYHSSGCQEQWNTFGLLWSDYFLIWYYNGEPVRQIARYTTIDNAEVNCNSIDNMVPYRRVVDHRWPLHPGSVILNLATWQPYTIENGGDPIEIAPDYDAYPFSLYVDYVKYYRLMECSTGRQILNDMDLELTNEYNVEHGAWFELADDVTLNYGQQKELVAEEYISLEPGFFAQPWSVAEFKVVPGLCSGSGMQLGQSAQTALMTVGGIEEETPQIAGVTPNARVDQQIRFAISSGQAIFELPSDGGTAQSKVERFVIQSITGQRVRAGTVQDSHVVLSTEELSPGVYLFEAIDNTGCRIGVARFVINK